VAIDLPDMSGKKKTYLMVGGVAAAYVGYRWWKARAAPAAAAVGETSVDAGTVTDSPGGSYGPGNVQYGGADITSDSSTPSTNAAWTNQAVTLLVQQGWDGATVQGALGAYLTDQSLSSTQATIVRAAIAVAGSPPQGSHSIIELHTPSAPASTKPTAPAGFRIATVGKTSAVATWAATAGATSYEVARVSGPWSGETTVTTPHVTFTGLRPGTRYTYRVRAVSAAGPGPWSGNQAFNTKK
jgi:hypothetical protein